MYDTHFGMRRRPFRSIPDSECYYPASGAERALARLLHALSDDESVVLVTGEPGTGKTLLGHCLLERLGDQAASAFLSNTHFPNRAALLRSILYDLGLPATEADEQSLRQALADYLLGNYAAGRRTVLILDEAQHLSTDLLEELRLLGNLEGKQGKAIQVVLLGQTSLRETLHRPELASLNQRIAARIQLEPLPTDEAVDYVTWHLRAAGARPERVFSDEALELLAQGSRGVPRLLNQAAHAALVLAHEAGAKEVDAEVVLEALGSLGLEAPSSLTEQFPSLAAASGRIALTASDPDEGMEIEEPAAGEAEGGTNPPHRLFPPPRHHA